MARIQEVRCDACGEKIGDLDTHSRRLPKPTTESVSNYRGWTCAAPVWEINYIEANTPYGSRVGELCSLKCLLDWMKCHGG